ncbi:Intradiol ring-cleavage dioxygenase core [Penicillium crustosum]|uniref:Intradiol ring-cleavage dioxygenase core n=1 Tax=Penicillium crustosum TaxID=36656 RepID=UPI0023993455|nr:Intradiol ring-cleavage dioxygenase core [Penicillium crustosum]KAJ5395261.1 Intradiol ring-cleavage dioxygenase core [Penicillium crustosum]
MVHIASALAVGLLGLAGAVSAHPGHDHRAEAAERRAFLDKASVHQRSLSNTNTQELTTNAEDSILSEEADTIDPVMEYVYLGDSVSDGIFAWITMGVDPTTDTTVTPAAYYTEDGGVEN